MPKDKTPIFFILTMFLLITGIVAYKGYIEIRRDSIQQEIMKDEKELLKIYNKCLVEKAIIIKTVSGDEKFIFTNDEKKCNILKENHLDKTYNFPSFTNYILNNL